MINSKNKGGRAERDLCKRLNERFSHLPLEAGRFSRSVGSGNRWGQKVQLSAAAAQTYGGDITSPEGFLWSLESKSGYPSIDLARIVEGPIGLLDDFLQQAAEDGKKTHRMPALIFRQDRKKPIVFVRDNEAPAEWFAGCLAYQGWLGVSLETWLKQPDEYFFEKEWK